MHGRQPPHRASLRRSGGACAGVNAAADFVWPGMFVFRSALGILEPVWLRRARALSTLNGMIGTLNGMIGTLDSIIGTLDSRSVGMLEPVWLRSAHARARAPVVAAVLAGGRTGTQGVLTGYSQAAVLAGGCATASCGPLRPLTATAAVAKYCFRVCVWPRPVRQQSLRY
jgi:hypothetical protein